MPVDGAQRLSFDPEGYRRVSPVLVSLAGVGVAGAGVYHPLQAASSELGVSLGRKAAGPCIWSWTARLKVFGEGEWKVRQHGYTKRRTWRKLHLSVDSETQEIQAVVLSEASLDDAGAVPVLMDQSTEPVEQMSGDGAYDKRKVYEGCAASGIRRVAIPPRKDARIWQHGNCAAPPLVRTRTCGGFGRQDASRGNKSRAIIGVPWPRLPCFGSRPSLAPIFRPGSYRSRRWKPSEVCRFEPDDPLGMPDSYRVA